MAKLSVFVACPYTLFPLPDYKKVFETVAKAYPVTFKFADEQITNQYILTKISNYIREHDISLFDITGWNANVSLELGIAVGMGKRYFILLNTHIDRNREAPSDIQGIERIQYTSNQELEAKISILLKQELPDKQDNAPLSGVVSSAVAQSTTMTTAQVADLLSRIDPKSVHFLKQLAANNGAITWGDTRTIFGIADNDDWSSFSAGYGKGITRAMRHMLGDKSARLVWWKHTKQQWDDDPDSVVLRVDGPTLHALRQATGVVAG
jgi:hypothetical protein